MREAAIWAVVPAAGSGSRMQGGIPKQYLPLAGRPILFQTLERLCTYARLNGVWVGVTAGDRHWSSLREDCGRLPRFRGAYDGGTLRAETVLNGLRAVSADAMDDDWVMVHDAVRPCVRHADLDRLVEAAREADGGLLALPVTDTVKRADGDGQVLETVPRTGLWRALTPQMFRLGRLRLALEQALARGEEITDEAAAIERLGDRPRVVAGQPDNIKITLPADLALAELYLRRQTEEVEGR
jgi:2-C-methyl-D-erythritol 4-phosphate cytidylyltransferase